MEISRNYDNTDYWSKSQTRELISLWEKCPCIYNMRDPNYPKRVKRDEKYMYILTELRVFNPKVTIAGIKQKIRTLTSQLSKERARVIAYKKAGAEANEEYVPKLWCYKELQFLINCNVNINGDSNLEMIDVDGKNEENNKNARKQEFDDSDPLDEEVSQYADTITETQDESDCTTEELVIERLNPDEDGEEYQHAHTEEPRKRWKNYSPRQLTSSLKRAKLEKTTSPRVTALKRDEVEAAWCVKKYKLEMEILQTEHEERMKMLREEREEVEDRKIQALEKHHLEMEILKCDLQMKKDF